MNDAIKSAARNLFRLINLRAYDENRAQDRLALWHMETCILAARNQGLEDAAQHLEAAADGLSWVADNILRGQAQDIRGMKDDL